MSPDEERINPRTALSDEDKAVLKEWRTAAVLQDHRYEPKALMSIVALAMADPDFRSRLVDDTPAALAELGDRLDLPAGYEFVFHENTDTTLHVVLPPLAGDASQRPPALREMLGSRTTTSSFFQDDFDYPDFHDSGHFNVADPHTRD